MSVQSFSSVAASASLLSQLQNSYSSRHANRSVSGGPVEDDGPVRQQQQQGRRPFGVKRNDTLTIFRTVQPPILLYSFADSYGNGDTTCDACCPKRKPRCCKPRRCCRPRCAKRKRKSCCKRKPRKCGKKRRFCPVGCRKRRPGYKQC